MRSETDGTSSGAPCSAVTAAQWDGLLSDLYGRISADPRCTVVLRHIGKTRFQFLFTDRPELSFWEDYDGASVRHRIGIADDYAIEATTTLSALAGTLLQRISLMEAAADEAFVMRGDAAALFRCANLLPFVMETFTDIVTTGDLLASLDGLSGGGDS